VGLAEAWEFGITHYSLDYSVDSKIIISKFAQKPMF
jgi:hypothetical protein